MPRFRYVASLGLATVTLWAGFPSGYAASFTVTSPGDLVDERVGDGVCRTALGTCTLRAAIQEANATPAPDVITLPAGQYSLAVRNPSDPPDSISPDSGDLDITAPLTIRGSGFPPSVINANRMDRVFDIIGTTVELSGLSIVNGRVNAPGASGGAIRNAGTLTLVDSDITSNEAFAGDGGGIANSGTLRLVRTTVHRNSAVRGGGMSSAAGLVTLSESVVRNNQTHELSARFAPPEGVLVSVAAGGGVNVVFGQVDISRTLIVGNQSAGVGGGLHIVDGQVSINESTLASNDAQRSGGAITNRDRGAITVTNSTISNNRSGIGGPPVDTGFPTISNFGSLTMKNVTVAANAPVGLGGSGVIEMSNSIVANADPSGNCEVQRSREDSLLRLPTIISLGYNLESGNSCELGAEGDVTNTDPLLGPLQDNAGPTPFHALLATSPAIDAGSPAAVGTGAGACESGDQRGTLRPLDGDADGSAVCDIGAYEAPVGISSRSAPLPAVVPGLEESELPAVDPSVELPTEDAPQLDE